MNRNVIDHSARLVLRISVVLLLVLWGVAKFTKPEAEAIKPLIEHSPFLSWMYAVLSVGAASAVIGVIELAVAALMLVPRWLPRASFYGSLGAALTFATTLSFLVTTPGLAASNSLMAGFLMKDAVLLGAALFTASDALDRIRVRAVAVA
jgi:reactive chlorine resistance protein C